MRISCARNSINNVVGLPTGCLGVLDNAPEAAHRANVGILLLHNTCKLCSLQSSFSCVDAAKVHVFRIWLRSSRGRRARDALYPGLQAAAMDVQFGLRELCTLLVYVVFAPLGKRSW